MAIILIVDDQAANRRFLRTLLHGQGHRLVEAADGCQALEAVKAEHPDLVITDILMPVMDGYEFVRQLRLDPATQQVPVLFYAAPYGAREARALAVASGAAYILPKQADSQEVLKIVARVLSGEPVSPEPAPAAPSSRSRPSDGEHLRLLSVKLSEKTDDLRVANARLRALINIGLDLGSREDSERLLYGVCSAAHDLFGATYTTLGIADRETRKVTRFAACGTDVDWIKIGDAVPGIYGRVVAEDRVMQGYTAGGDPAALELPALHPEVQTYLVAPLASPFAVYGWICLVGNEGQVYSEDDADLLVALSGQVGRIYELEHEISERTAAESSLRQERDQRTQALESLRSAEERTGFALKAARVGIWDQDFTTGVLIWSETIEAQYGLKPGAFGGTFDAFVALIHPDDREQALATFAKAMKAGSDFTVQHRSLWQDGTVRWLSGAGRILLGENGEPMRGVGVSMDVTDRHILEAQFQQAQKMEAIGRLAGGVAHDFNNLLTAILGYCELLLTDLDPSDPHQADIAEIQKAGLFAAGLTRQLLAFSRKEIIEPKVLDLNEVVSGMRALLERLIGEDVKIVLALRPHLASVLADRGQLEQIVMNLAVNSRDAMPKGGTLTIETANVTLDEDYPQSHLAVQPGAYVALTVTDTGIGMTPAVQSRLFEPFFTTKPAGQGTGLGLATVHGFVTRSGGSVNIYSEVGRGTSIKVYLPRAGTEAPVEESPPPARRSDVGTQTVLVVEDAEGLRELIRRLLERQGYKVLVAADGEEAVRLSLENPSIDVLLSDVVMPGTSGPELSRRLVALRPEMKVIYMSGYTEDAIVHHEVLNPGVAFLHKPFTSESLGRKLREVIEG